ncbi:MAG: radical SAM protein [bacterium]
MGLLYIAEHLRQNDVDVVITDLSGEENYDIPYADIYGLTVYISSLQTTIDIVMKCKGVNPDCKIVVGGAHPTACPGDLPYADHVVVGYGEVAMLKIIRGEDVNRIVAGGECKDTFVFPAYDMVDVSSYHRTIDGRPSLPYITSRGCPFKCFFCGLAKMHGLRVSSASPEVVYSHVKRMKDEFGIDRINFQDDIFTLDFKRLSKMLELLNPLGIKFRCMGRAGIDTEEVYSKLAESGCVQIAWGIESGSQSILNKMGKKVTVEDNYNVIQWAKKYGITSRAFFIIGFPGETAETIEETKQFIEVADPDQYFVSNFIPYPGTAVSDHPKSFGVRKIYKEDYSQFYQVSKDGTGGSVIDTDWLSRSEFKILELSFRKWISMRQMRGDLQIYEK